jgi:hypothetical protein
MEKHPGPWPWYCARESVVLSLLSSPTPQTIPTKCILISETIISRTCQYVCDSIICHDLPRIQTEDQESDDHPQLFRTPSILIRGMQISPPLRSESEPDA